MIGGNEVAWNEVDGKRTYGYLRALPFRLVSEPTLALLSPRISSSDTMIRWSQINLRSFGGSFREPFSQTPRDYFMYLVCRNVRGNAATLFFFVLYIGHYVSYHVWLMPFDDLFTYDIFWYLRLQLMYLTWNFPAFPWSSHPFGRIFASGRTCCVVLAECIAFCHAVPLEMILMDICPGCISMILGIPRHLICDDDWWWFAVLIFFCVWCYGSYIVCVVYMFVFSVVMINHDVSSKRFAIDTDCPCLAHDRAGPCWA